MRNRQRSIKPISSPTTSGPPAQSSFAWRGTPGVGSLAGSASGSGPVASSGNAWSGTPGCGSPDGSTSNFSPSVMLSPLFVGRFEHSDHPRGRRLARPTLWQLDFGSHDQPKHSMIQHSPNVEGLPAICSHCAKRLVRGGVKSVCSVRIVETGPHGCHTRPIARRRTRARRWAKSAGSLMNHAPIRNCGRAADHSGGRP
jgi:hypothetical protein